MGACLLVHSHHSLILHHNLLQVFHGRICVGVLTLLFDFTLHSSALNRIEIIQRTTLEIKLQWLLKLCGTSPILSLRTLPIYIIIYVILYI